MNKVSNLITTLVQTRITLLEHMSADLSAPFIKAIDEKLLYTLNSITFTKIETIK